MSAEGLRETTPLLAGQVRPRENGAEDPDVDEQAQLPAIAPACTRLQREGIPSDDGWSPHGLTPIQKTAFMIVVLSRMSMQGSKPPEDLWDQWQHQRTVALASHEAEKKVLQLWNMFLSQPRSPAEISLLLWQGFPVSENITTSVRVVDVCEYLPAEVLQHPVFTASVNHAWTRGIRHLDLGSMPLLPRMLARFDAVSTPRVLHFLDLCLYLGYLATLSRFALAPRGVGDTNEVPPPTVREWGLIIYSLARVVSQWSLSAAPFLLASIAICLSVAPSLSLSELGYSLALLALSIHVLQLHLPFPPTPILLFLPDQTLPLAILLWHGVSRIFIPVTLFFIPALSLTILLLSLSLSDVIGFISPFAAQPSPLEARSAFVVLFAILFSLLICSLVMLILIYPSLSSSPHPSNSWDRYSEPIGLSARRAFTAATVAYSSPYLFIPPFNLIQLLLFRAPGFILGLAQAKTVALQLRTVEKVVWRVSVGLFCWTVSSFWLWNML